MGLMGGVSHKFFSVSELLSVYTGLAVWGYPYWTSRSAGARFCSLGLGIFAMRIWGGNYVRERK